MRSNMNVNIDLAHLLHDMLIKIIEFDCKVVEILLFLRMTCIHLSKKIKMKCTLNYIYIFNEIHDSI